MKKIKAKYWLIISLIIVVSTVFIPLNICYKFLDGENMNLIVAVIALVISMFSIALADLQFIKFNGKVTIWRTGKDLLVVNGQKFSNFAFNITNKSKLPLSEFCVSFRFPEQITYNYINHPDKNYQNHKFFQYGETYVINNDTLKFLGNNSNDNEARFEHYLDLSKWPKNRYLYITISGREIQPMTYQVQECKNFEIQNSTNNKPFVLS